MRKTTVIAVLMLIVTLSEAYSQETEKNLIGYWRFDEGEGLMVKDSSGNGKDGRIANKGRGVRRVEGRTGRAIELTGGDPSKRGVAGCIEIPNTGENNFTKGITIELWVKFIKIDRSQTYELVSNTFNDRGKGFRLVLSWLQLSLFSGEGDAGKTWGAATSQAKTKIESRIWYHIAATYNGSLYRVYLDGEEVAASKPKLTMTKGRPTIYIGSYNCGYAYGLNGVVDDVKIYNYARTALEILEGAKFDF